MQQPTALRVDATDLAYRAGAYRLARMTAIRMGCPVTASWPAAVCHEWAGREVVRGMAQRDIGRNEPFCLMAGRHPQQRRGFEPVLLPSRQNERGAARMAGVQVKPPHDRPPCLGGSAAGSGRSREVTNGSLVAAKLTEDPCAKRRLRGSPDARSGSAG